MFFLLILRLSTTTVFYEAVIIFLNKKLPDGKREEEKLKRSWTEFALAKGHFKDKYPSVKELKLKSAHVRNMVTFESQ